MPITNERNGDYTSQNKEQLGKADSVKISKTLVRQVYDLVLPLVEVCEEYEPDKTLRLSGAPAVKINEKLVIAPDLKCTTKNGNIFWIEVKDKCQRFFMPDTGADVHQVLGWYDINKYNKEPVLVIFRDPPLEKCVVGGQNTDKYTERWNKFSGQPYGNWLSNLLVLNNRTSYPKLYPERSRQDVMHICYFHIENMISIDLNVLKQKILEVDAQSVPVIPQNFQMYLKENSNFTLIDESRVRTLSIGG
jgi:hypothetical protein